MMPVIGRRTMRVSSKTCLSRSRSSHSLTPGPRPRERSGHGRARHPSSRRPGRVGLRVRALRRAHGRAEVQDRLPELRHAPRLQRSLTVPSSRGLVAVVGTENAQLFLRMKPEPLSQEACAFYVGALRALRAAGVPFLVGGAYAMERYTGLSRNTKDLDVFVHPRDTDAALAALADAGHQTEIAFPHWLGKAHCGDDTVD